jgi:hypothetical protein
MKSFRNSIRRVTVLAVFASAIAFVPASAFGSTNPTPPPPTFSMDWSTMMQVALSAFGL